MYEEGEEKERGKGGYQRPYILKWEEEEWLVMDALGYIPEWKTGRNVIVLNVK